MESWGWRRDHQRNERAVRQIKMMSAEWRRGLPLYLMILPGLLFFLLFKYLPMAGLVIAFQSYNPFEGIFHSDWVGFDNFKRLFTDVDFYRLLANTLTLSAINLFLFFPAPIILALIINELGKGFFKKLMQTVIYLPHFLSWVVVVGLTSLLFATQDGGINNWLASNGFARIELLSDPAYFRPLFLMHNLWKEAGWNTIIFLAALASVDPMLYEAADMDGAGRWRKLWSVTLPSLRSTIIILFILRLGSVMEIGYEHVYLLQNTLNLKISNIFDTYVYRQGIQQGDFSFSTAVGLFKGLVGLALIMMANKLSKKAGEEGLY
ncbi:protein lplB [Paenibacillus pectinilyticus]|uniref:Protein lplB n=2 Tax=Paenibacillus pectinilyticus TaxID=512399 RepID=A0A1C0ZSP0_9BACL|nr:protein lplB [Paenibacillus pectinilyticus]